MRRRKGPVHSRYRLSREERARVGGARQGLKLNLPTLRFSPALLKIVGGIAGVVLVIVILSRLLGGGGIGIPGTAGPSEEEITQWRTDLEEAATGNALQLGMRESWILVHQPGSPEGDSLLTVFEFRVPGDLHLEVLNLALTNAVEESGGDVVRGIELNDARVELDAAFRGRMTHRLVLQRYSGYSRQAGRLAIIIDDFGRTDQQMVTRFADLDIPWTASVIPGLPFSRNQARYLSGRNILILLHMPMEPEAADDWDLGEDAIYADTPVENIDRLVGEAADEISVAQGLNNHMGSMATTEATVMGALMESLKKRDLFFIDSYTTPASVAIDEAVRAGIRWARRDVFLDPEDDTGIIEEQLQRSLEEARQNGSVILIGHPREKTLEVLLRWIPGIREAGFQFVTVDKLLRR